MEFEKIKTQTTWSDAAASLNRTNERIGVELDRLGAATYKNKGYFLTVDALRATFPKASAGARAYVGTSYPYSIYLWSGYSNTWVDSGTTGGDETVNLRDYYTKEETMKVIDDYHVVLSQTAYDALMEKEDKLYFTYED